MLEPSAPVRRLGRPAGQTGTSGRILDAAERLFAEVGFPSCSIRMIAEEAGVNSALIHHYFGSKEELFVRVYLRRARPIAALREAMLDAAERDAVDGPVPLETLVRCFIEPPLRLAAESAGGRAFVRIQARVQSGRGEVASRMRREVYDRSTFRFVRAFRRALPQLPPAAIFWRMSFMISVFVGINAQNGRLETISEGACIGTDVAAAIEHAVPFLVAGFLAAAPGGAAAADAVLAGT